MVSKLEDHQLQKLEREGREGAQTRRSQGIVPNEKKGDWNHKEGFRAHTAIFLHICTNPGNFITTKKASQLVEMFKTPSGLYFSLIVVCFQHFRGLIAARMEKKKNYTFVHFVSCNLHVQKIHIGIMFVLKRVHFLVKILTPPF